jgi:hypothetical protein
LRLDQEDGLAGEVEALAAPDVAASDHVIDADHIGARLFELLLIFRVGAGGRLCFFRADHPADWVGVLLPAVRAVESHLLSFFFFVVEALVVHGQQVSRKCEMRTERVRAETMARADPSHVRYVLIFADSADRRARTVRDDNVAVCRQSRRRTLRGGVDFVEIDEANALIAPAREPMRKRIDGVLTITFENPMVAVVQQ